MSTASSTPTEYKFVLYVNGIIANLEQMNSFNYDLRGPELSPLVKAIKHAILEQPENRRY